MAEANSSTNGASSAPPAENSGTKDKDPAEPGTSRTPQAEVSDSLTSPGTGTGEGEQKGSQGEDSSQSDAEDPAEILDPEQLGERLGEARKAVVVGRYEEAMRLLPSCLDTITSEAGELSVKLAEPHYLYGRSLFECARVGAGVIGDGILKENPEKNKGDSGEDGTESTEEVNETEPNNFEVAWENLEVSRVICSKQLERDSSDVSVAKIMLEVLTCLGELQVETGCYEKAAADYTDCLQLLSKHPDISTQQVVGATHFSVGVAYSLAGEHQLAVEALKSALDVLSKLLGEQEEDTQEASSLQELIDEIKPRLVEAIEQAREKLEQVQLKSQSDQPTSSNGDKQSQVPAASVPVEPVKVNDISHLMRKKRPVEEVADGQSDTTSPKKAKSEQEVSTDKV